MAMTRGSEHECFGLAWREAVKMLPRQRRRSEELESLTWHRHIAINSDRIDTDVKGVRLKQNGWMLSRCEDDFKYHKS